jgi:uncharacterized FAD-dependent dehydrogenase
MLRISNVKINILNDDDKHIKSKIEKLIHNKINSFKIVKKSLDARKELMYVYTFDIEVDNEEKVLKEKNVIRTPNEEYIFPELGKEELTSRPVVVGSGPAGLFLGYFLSKYGYKPIIIERGEKIENRVKTVDEFWKTNKLNENSNPIFGEGGAGTFSDGKLNTLVKDKYNRIREVFKIFVDSGAPEEIMYTNKPHIGTDVLRNVVINLRNKIINYGGEFRYNTCLTNIVLNGNKLEKIVVNNNEEIITNNLFLAIGHSARDTYHMLNDNNIKMLSKPFAVGLRIIHKEEQISKDLYGESYKLLEPANYKLTYTTKEGRGVYSFCMCPGGYVINASSEKGYLSINGMSDYKRDSGYSNSALVVTVNSNDYGTGLFDGLNFQKELERKAYEIGNGNIPVQRYEDFVNNTVNEVKTGGIKGKYIFKNLNDILPEYISSSIKEAMPHFSKQISSFEKDAILLGIESRTSSPLTILRDDIGESNIKGIYPCGEGAGYSGGITTSAVDGIIQVENFAKRFKPFN